MRRHSRGAVGFCIVCEAPNLFDQAVMHAHGLPSRDAIRSAFTQRTVDQLSGICYTFFCRCVLLQLLDRSFDGARVGRVVYTGMCFSEVFGGERRRSYRARKVTFACIRRRERRVSE